MLAGMDKSDPSYKGQSGYNAAMLAIYDVWVLKLGLVAQPSLRLCGPLRHDS
jgi:hypothetical protein